MKSRRSLGAIALAAIATVALVRLAVMASRHAPPSVAADDTREELEALKAKVRGLEGHVVGQQVMIAKAIAGSGDPSPVSPADASAPAQAHEPTGTEIVAQLDTRFLTEPAHTAWGSGASARAAAAFRDHLPPGSSLGQIECRETMCRIETRHEGLAAYRKFVRGMLLARDNGLWNGGVDSEVTAQTADAVSSVTFIAREDESIPVSAPGPE